MEKTYLLSCILLSCLLFSFRSAHCETFCVDTEVMLQNALNSAATNNQDDEIQIVQGTYYGNFTYSSIEGKAITLKGGYLKQGFFFCSFPNPTPSASRTILDGGQNGRVVFIENTDGGGVGVAGLTIRNGRLETPGGGLPSSGSGIRIDVGPDGVPGLVELHGNIIEDNHGSRGGGGFVRSESYNGDSGIVWIRENIVRNNEGHYGGGIYITSHSVSGKTGFIAVEGNTLINNFARNEGGGLHVVSYGKLDSEPISITNNNILWNQAKTTGIYGAAGGLFVRGTVTSGALGTIDISNNIIAANTGWANGAGLRFELSSENDSGKILLIHNTIVNNYSNWNSSEFAVGGGLYYKDKQPIELINNIIIGNSVYTPDGDIGGDIFLDSNATSARAFNNDYGKMDGAWQHESNNINVNPQFVGSGNYHLRPSSPCRDRGTTNYPLPVTDMDGDKRLLFAAPDLGADEITQPYFHWPMFLPAFSQDLRNKRRAAMQTKQTRCRHHEWPVAR